VGRGANKFDRMFHMLPLHALQPTSCPYVPLRRDSLEKLVGVRTIRLANGKKKSMALKGAATFIYYSLFKITIKNE